MAQAGDQLAQPGAGVARAVLSQAGTVIDGYDHELVVDATDRVYVVQTGGFAGLRTVYGPLDAPGHCRREVAQAR